MRARARAGRQDARIVRPADDHPDPAGSAKRKENIQRPLLQQRIAPCQQEDVEIAALGQPLAGRHFVQPRPECRDHAILTQLQQRLVAPRHEFRQFRIDRRMSAMREYIKVMRIQDVDPVYPEPLQRKFHRPHRTVIAIVIDFIARRHVDPLGQPVTPVRRGGAEQASDLGGQHVCVARLAPQEPVQPGF
jgi:hypothetical protein